MTFKQGQLDTNDLSPNAGILGTQIADNTIQFRNLEVGDFFKIVKSGTATLTYSFPSHAGPNSGTDTASVTIAHGLSYIPVAQLFITYSTNQSPIAHGSIYDGAQFIPSLDFFIRYFSVSIDATNLVIILNQAWCQVTSPPSYPAIAGSIPLKYYLMENLAS